MRCFAVAQLPGLADNDAEVLRHQLSDKPLPDEKEYLGVKIAFELGGVFLGNLDLVLLKPLIGDFLEGVADNLFFGFLRQLSFFFTCPGSLPFARSSRAFCRASRASLRLTSGYWPKLRSFCLPSKR